MSRAYSLDLRERVVASMHGGLSSYEAAAHYQVSQSSAQRWFNRALSKGSPAALPVGGRRGFLLADKLDWITRRLAEAQDTTLQRTSNLNHNCNAGARKQGSMIAIQMFAKRSPLALFS